MNSRQRKNFIIFMVTLLLMALIPAPYEAEETTAFPQLATQQGAAKLDLTDPSLDGNKSKGPKNRLRK